MSTDLAERQPSALVTAEQLDLVRRTVAKDATADELKLYLYDCSRQGVHPLDRLIHFTKRNGKYTPITSIDFMRIRAADTGEYAGSDDAIFDGSQPPDAASVTVWRLVQGQRCGFTATARWSEYKPEQNDFMWRKMPHTMLGKCAEALALRKGFPRQLSGLYAKEEMDQSDVPSSGYVVSAPGLTEKPENASVPNAGESGNSLRAPVSDRAAINAPLSAPAGPSVPNGGESGANIYAPEPLSYPPLPDESAVYIDRVQSGHGKVLAEVMTHQGETAAVFNEQLKALAEEVCQQREPVYLEIVISKASNKPYIKGIKRATLPSRQTAPAPASGEPLKDSDIPF